MLNSTNFELHTHDIDVIERLLRREIGAVSIRANNQQHPGHEEAREELHVMRTLLGRLQNQKAIASVAADVVTPIRATA